MKRIFAFFSLALLGTSLFCERFRIVDVAYEITGKTKEYAIEQAVEISTTRVFGSYDELNDYVKDVQQLFQNERVFDSASVTMEYGETPDANGILPVRLRVLTRDSKHLMIVPYPKYNSNDGLTLKIKVKDMNFLGTMNEMNFDVNFAMEQEDESSHKDFVLGLNFDFDYPFRLGPFKASWNNDFSIDYTFGKSKPEFDVSTGFTLELPFDMFAIRLTLTQSVAQNFDYTEYDDELYFTEDATLELPITLARIDNWGNVTWTPSVSYTWNWDKNGISKENDDLSSPLLTVGHSIATGRVNWYGNFREGLSAEVGQSIGYNFQRDEYIPKVWAELSAYNAFRYLGITGRLYGFAASNTTESIGSRLRGIRDDQKYKHLDKKALSVPFAVVGNIDMPIHIVTTDWNAFFAWLFGEDSKAARALSFMRYLDFELQIAPFVDFALAKNAETGTIFYIKDGFYAGGLEVLVYPARWRSIEVRASVGIDAGRKIVKKAVSKLINTDWRKGVAAYEIYVGIGLHY